MKDRISKTGLVTPIARLSSLFHRYTKNHLRDCDVGDFFFMSLPLDLLCKIFYNVIMIMNPEQKKAYLACRKVFREAYERYYNLNLMRPDRYEKNIIIDKYRTSLTDIVFKARILEDYIFGIGFDMTKGIYKTFGSPKLFIYTNPLDEVKKAIDIGNEFIDEINKKTALYRFLYMKAS